MEEAVAPQGTGELIFHSSCKQGGFEGAMSIAHDQLLLCACSTVLRPNVNLGALQGASLTVVADGQLRVLASTLCRLLIDNEALQAPKRACDHVPV